MRALVFVVACLVLQSSCCTLGPGNIWKKMTYSHSHVLYFGPGSGGVIQEYDSVYPVGLSNFFIYDQYTSILSVMTVTTTEKCELGELTTYGVSFAPDCASVVFTPLGEGDCTLLQGQHRLVGCTAPSSERCFLSDGHFYLQPDDDDEIGKQVLVGPRSEEEGVASLAVIEFRPQSNSTVFMRWIFEASYESEASSEDNVFDATIAGVYSPAAGIVTPETTPSFCSSSYTYAYEFAGPLCSQLLFILQDGLSCVDTISGLGGTATREVCLDPINEYWSQSYWLGWSYFDSIDSIGSPSSNSGGGGDGDSTSEAAAIPASLAAPLLLLLFTLF